MFKRLIYLICFVLVLSLMGDVQAADVAWTDATGDHLWSTPGNWDTGALPTSADTVKIRIVPGPIVANPGAIANVVQPGAGGTTGDLTINGGTLTINNRLVVAQSNGSDGTLNMISGTITVGGRYAVARYGVGTLNMTGGTITATGPLQMPEMASGTAHANLHGGVITVDNLEMRATGGVGTIDIGAGTLIINGDRLSTVQEYIDNGWITAYEGNGTLQLDYNITNIGQTTLSAFLPQLTIASNPIPAYPATDVPRDVVLSWTPGIYADKHDVYFNTNFDDVNNADRTDPLGVLVNQNQDANSYDPGRLNFDTTYYWRIDEVNSPPDYTVFEGKVWSFTTELLAYPIENITATASSSVADRVPENTVNGSGLDDSGLLHGTDAENTMWLSDAAGPQPSWIQYEFDNVYKLYEMWVWNSNETMEPVIGFGFKDVTIEYSTDGIDYTTLGTTHEFARAPGAPDYEHNTTIDFGGAPVKYVRLTANSNWGGILPQFGLCEVRFFYIPVLAREPNPTSGATDVNVDVVLSFKAGREAATHNVYFSTDEQAVVDGTATVTTVTEANYGPLSLDLAQTYYWRVDEVNEAETPNIWQGNLWDFATKEYFVVDDIESYNDLNPEDPESHRIFNVWIDGYEELANGSLVGYDVVPFCEHIIVHGGKQSMPFFFNNTSGATYSEAELTLSQPEDWTKHDVKTLSLWFYGDPNNTAAQMYVKVNGSKVTYDGDAGNLTATAWQPWNIELTSFGADLQSVTKLAVGIDGDGAAGKLFFDDIRLYPYSRQLATPVEPATAGLVAHYEFEGTANDSSGNGLNGTVMGTPAFVAGKVGQAISLSGLNDFVEITGYKGILGTKAVTVTAWINTTSTETGTIVGWGPNVDGQRFGFRVNENRLRMENAGGNVQGDSKVNDGRWHHVAVTVKDNATISYPEVILYVDGIDDTRPSTDPDAFNLAADQDVRIGSRPVDNDRFFLGLIDDVRIYERALTEEEIAWLAGRTKPFDKPF